SSGWARNKAGRTGICKGNATWHEKWAILSAGVDPRVWADFHFPSGRDASDPRSMRIVIFAMGSAGDVHPFLGVGRALTARGHEVVVAASGHFAETVAAAGLTFRELGSAEDYERLCSHPDLWHPRRALGAVLKHGANQSYPRILEISREFHEPGRTILVGSSLSFGARNARDLL